MNEYEDKQEQRRQRYLQRAEAQENKAQQAHDTVDQISSYIPPGQPILVGHHSEKRHRRDLQRIDNTMRKAIEANDKADYYRQKAAAVGEGGISSDDPEALAKLREKDAELEAWQNTMKKINAALRRAKIDPNAPGALPQAIEVAAKTCPAPELMERATKKLESHIKYGSGGLRFPSYALQNNNANLRRVRQRIADLERRQATAAAPDLEGDGYTLREDAEDNRILFIFDVKPPKEIRRLMRTYGFRWSPSRMAWCRQLTNAGRYSAKMAAEAIEERGAL